MGHSPVAHPSPGAPGGLTPAQAKKFFEFFSAGTHREVVFLGDLVEQPVHYVRSKGHKVLCGARVGVCQLCQIASDDKDTSTQQTEYYAPAYVRTWREKEYHQRVAVFSDAAGRQLLAAMGGAQLRGRRIEVSRKSQGTSPRFTIDPREGNPAGFPSNLPDPFDLVPFIRARYGRLQTADRPLVFLPSIRTEASGSSIPARPRALSLTAEDCTPGEEMLNKFRNWQRARKAEDEKPDPTAAIPPATPIPAAVIEPAVTPAEEPPATLPIRPAVPMPEGTFTIDGDIDHFIYGRHMERGPKLVERKPVSPEDDGDSVQKLCADLKEKHGYLNGKKPNPSANGGAK